MENVEKYICDKVSAYADEVLDGIDPQKVQVSFQLEKLKPCMEELAKELGLSVEDVFIKYMDAASERSVDSEKKFQSTMGHMDKYGDFMQFEQIKKNRYKEKKAEPFNRFRLLIYSLFYYSYT